jgi:hypothetical protein
MFAEKYVFNLQMMFRLVTSVVVICLTLAQQSSANDGYGGGDGGYGGGSYEAPPPKTKFNIGFNLPAMSISLPKLELPQISIKASVKNKKPFTLKMPIIKFNAHASTEEEYGGGDYGGGQPQAYGEADGGPSAYASSGNGISGYANSGPEMQAYAASAANPKIGYQRPAAGQYNEAPAQPQSYAPGSGYNNPAPEQNQNTPYAAGPQVYSRQIQQAAPQEQVYAAAQNIHSPTHGYTSQAHQTFTPQHNYQPQPLPQIPAPRPVQQAAVGPVYQVTPAVTANGYHVPRPAQSANQVPEYKDENVKFYGAAPLYQSAPLNPSSSGSGPVIEEFYGGTRLQPSRYGRRSTRNPYLENVGGVFLASASDQNGPFILTPFNERMDLIRWNPLIRQ